MAQTPVTKKRVISKTQKAFNVWGIIVIIWAFYRSSYGANSPLAFDEFVIKPILFVAPVLYFVFKHEHKNLATGLWLKTSELWKEVKASLLITLPLLVLMPLHIFFVKKQFDLTFLGTIFMISIAIAVTEEILSRGFIARTVWEESGSVVKTIIQASLLHMFLRIPRILTMQGVFGERLILFFLSDLALSFAITCIFLWRKNLISAVLVRFVFTFFLMAVLL